MKTRLTLPLLTTAATACLATPAHAGEINFLSWASGVASVAGESVVTAAPGNDDIVGANPNVLSIIQKDYFAIGPVDIILNVTDAGNGTTEYVVIEGVQNSSPMDWNGYHIELGFGSGAGFVKSTPGDGLDFDTPDITSPVDFAPGPVFHTTITRPTEDDLIATGDIQNAGEYSGNSFIFHVDVPDGISTFTIRQSPLPVPEPTSALALALLAGMTLRRRR